MELESNTELAPGQPPPAKPVPAGEKRPHTYWAEVKGHCTNQAHGNAILNAMHYAIAKQLRRWPHPDLDPSHGITEQEFDDAIKEASGVSAAKPKAGK